MNLEEIDILDLDHYKHDVPHELFDQLRREAPVFWNKESEDNPGFWAVTKYADVKHVSRNPLTFSSTLGTNIIDFEPHILPIIQGIMLNMDPPRHIEYRSLVRHRFTPRRVTDLKAYVRKRAREIVDAIAARGGCDFVDDVAAELPMSVICEIFGIAEADRRSVYELANRLISADDPEVIGDETPDDVLAEAFQRGTELGQFKREHPGDDMATDIVQGELDGDATTDWIFATFFIMMIVAGNETTRTVTTNGMLRLIQNPSQLREVADDISLLPNAVEEMLRFDPGVHHFRRTATEDVELRGQKIRKGDKVAVWYGPANRDDEVFANPHRFDIHRPNARHHLTFGIGEHFCLGAHLARLQLNSIFEEVLTRIPEMELAAEPRRLRSNFVNSVKEMRVRFKPES